MAARPQRGTTRRTALKAAAVGAGLAWLPAWVPAGPALADGCVLPGGFPADVEVGLVPYRNWSGQVVVDRVPTCFPRTADDVVRVADWARANGYRLRPKGRAHGWSPLTLPVDATCDARVVLVDTTRHLVDVTVDVGRDGGPAVRAGAGVLLERLLDVLGAAGLGMTAAPELGDITVAGVLAIGGHGTAVPASGELRLPGHTHGSLSNLVLELTAVVWDADAGRHRLRTFRRTDGSCASVLTALGRVLVTEVVLRTGPDTPLRCRSIVDVPASELFGAPGSTGRLLDRYLRETGRVSALWFPFADNPWLKVYSVAPVRPASSREVSGPYNYTFSDNLPEPLQELSGDGLRENPSAAPLFSQLSYAAVVAGLAATQTYDIWGPSRFLLLSLRPSTTRIEQSGQAVLVARADVQQVVHRWTTEYARLRDAYAEDGRYPVNMPVEIRATGLDHPGDVGVPGAEPPALSPLRPDRWHPERDVAVWLNAPTVTGTPGYAEFAGRLERWTATALADIATVRPEWSKGWAYTPDGAWTDASALDGGIAASFDDPVGGGWRRAVTQLDALDPARVVTSPLLDRLLR